MRPDVKKLARKILRDKRAQGETPSATGPCALASTVYTEGPKPPATCSTCNRDPARMNSAVAECSHVDCPHRRRAWSDRPTAVQLFKGPWPKNTEADPVPINITTSEGA